eukprot:1230881-Prymnesium_polylepis.1
MLPFCAAQSTSHAVRTGGVGARSTALPGRCGAFFGRVIHVDFFGRVIHVDMPDPGGSGRHLQRPSSRTGRGRCAPAVCGGQLTKSQT